MAISGQSIFVSAKNSNDKAIFKEKLVDMIKETMDYYEMDISSSDADKLYWQNTYFS